MYRHKIVVVIVLLTLSYSVFAKDVDWRASTVCRLGVTVEFSLFDGRSFVDEDGEREHLYINQEGSCTLIGGGYALTSNHVVSIVDAHQPVINNTAEFFGVNPVDIVVTQTTIYAFHPTTNLEKHPVVVLYTDEKRDLAFIHIPSLTDCDECRAVTSFTHSSNIDRGTKGVVSFGYKLGGGEVVRTAGFISKKAELKKGIGDTITFPIQALLSPGMSGGPTFQGNNLVGINSQIKATLKTPHLGLGRVIPGEEITAFLKEVRHE